MTAAKAVDSPLIAPLARPLVVESSLLMQRKLRARRDSVAPRGFDQGVFLSSELFGCRGLRRLASLGLRFTSSWGTWCCRKSESHKRRPGLPLG